MNDVSVGPRLWFAILSFLVVVFFICFCIMHSHRVRRLREQHDAVNRSRDIDRQRRWQQQEAYDVEETPPPIHPLSLHPFDHHPATIDRRAVLTKVIPSGVVLKTSNEHEAATMGDFPGIHQLLEIETSCTICLVDYTHGEAIRTSSRRCHHVFHESCILQWLELHNECPCCRQPVLNLGENPSAEIVAVRQQHDDGQNTSIQQEADYSASAYDLDELRPLSALFPSFLSPHARSEYISSLISIGTTSVTFNDEFPDLGAVVQWDDGERIVLTNHEHCLLCNEPYGMNSSRLGRSPNPACNHHFHQACIVHHLIHSTSCPRCFRQFVNIDGGYDDDEENQDEENNIVE